MIPPVHETTTIETSDNFKTRKFTIDKKSFSHIFRIVRDSLYSDKEGSVIRELVSNSFDSHTLARKCPSEISVSLPTNNNPYFIVRDRGIGLSEKDVFSLYLTMGNSTKRETNECVGSFGIGRFSAFSVCKSYFLNAFDGKKKRVYHCFIDENDEGDVQKMAEVDSDEPVGVEVQIPVEQKYHHNFHSKAKEFFKWWDKKPQFIPDISIPFEIPSFSGTGWTYYHKQVILSIRMGCVTYPIHHIDQIEDEAFNQGIDFKGFFRNGFIIDVPIGDIEVTASREAVAMTDFTKKNLVKRFSEVYKEAFENVLNQITQTDTFMGGCEKYHEYFGMYGKFAGFRRSLNQEMTHKSGREIITADSFDLPAGFKHHYRSYRGVCKSEDVFKIEFVGKKNLFHNFNSVKNIKRRISKYLESNNGELFFFSGKKEEFDKFVAETGCDYEFKDIATLPYDPVVRIREVEEKTELNGYYYKHNYHINYSIYLHSIDPTVFKRTEIDSESEGYYVEYDSKDKIVSSGNFRCGIGDFRKFCYNSQSASIGNIFLIAKTKIKKLKNYPNIKPLFEFIDSINQKEGYKITNSHIDNYYVDLGLKALKLNNFVSKHKKVNKILDFLGENGKLSKLKEIIATHSISLPKTKTIDLTEEFEFTLKEFPILFYIRESEFYNKTNIEKYFE